MLLSFGGRRSKCSTSCRGDQIEAGKQYVGYPDIYKTQHTSPPLAHVLMQCFIVGRLSLRSAYLFLRSTFLLPLEQEINLCEGGLQ